VQEHLSFHLGRLVSELVLAVLLELRVDWRDRRAEELDLVAVVLLLGRGRLRWGQRFVVRDHLEDGGRWAMCFVDLFYAVHVSFLRLRG
jgi:hypothetical protein